MNKLILLWLILLFIGCQQKENSFYFKSDSPIILQGELGDIEISLRNNSLLIDQIEIYNKEKELLYSQIVDDNGVVKGKLRENNTDSIFYKNFKFFLLGKEKNVINDTLNEEIYHNLVTTRELKVNNDILYLEMDENGIKRYNALNLKLINSEWVSEDRVNLLLKNYFPFEGEFEFYYPSSQKKISSKKLAKNYYMVEFQRGSIKNPSIKIDVEIIPSEKDSLIHSIFTQEIFVKEISN